MAASRPTEGPPSRYTVLLLYPQDPRTARAETFLAVVDAPSVSLACMLARQCCQLSNPELSERVIMRIQVLLVLEAEHKDVKFQAPFAAIWPA